MQNHFSLEAASWSRNDWEEPEDDEQFTPPRAPLFMWSSKHHIEGKLSVDKMVVGFNGVGTVFLSSHYDLDRLDIVGTIILPEVDMDTLLVLCQYEITPERAFEWVETLFDHVSPRQTYTLHGQLSKFLEEGERNVLRKIQHSTQPQEEDKTICPFLESVTIVSGAPAAVLTYCQAKANNVTSFVSLWDGQIDEGSVSILEPTTPLYQKEVMRKTETARSFYSQHLRSMSANLQQNALFV
ncbi:hypothetical protein PROFUN_00486 [Planoprotostelium fungivorum]|uniref:Proteasome assembly chaperone 1 n=1 Tax=Planoprotostelium fungivorum TaxID=1890364 RepID=A0A2P6N0Z2_9EUKA|nr:hypothetical protein PROFUN_00486 [Planoprotostelium fungivorum]